MKRMVNENHLLIKIRGKPNMKEEPILGGHRSETQTNNALPYTLPCHIIVHNLFGILP